MTDCDHCGLQISSKREIDGYSTCNDRCESESTAGTIKGGMTLRQLELVDEIVEKMKSGMTAGQAANEISCRHGGIRKSVLDTIMILAQDEFYSAKIELK